MNGTNEGRRTDQQQFKGSYHIKKNRKGPQKQK
jgi:hypothetical protein